MKKKIITLLVGALVLTAAVPNAFAALSNSQKSDIAKLEAQIAGLRKQIVQKYVAGGEITPEQGKAMQDQIDQAQKYGAENGYGPGFGGCFGGGYGGMMGGYGYMMNGYGYGNNVAPSSTNNSQGL